ncbi:secreted frizzled-related protein 1-like isoform X2 [Haliotis rubra]|uniref:secreted frizzled-related protein 1-like isoform X2 n=1 Tax=Haliotis rubra TaxID=36100 RepID=UPI001EE5EA59|nr:secreted frizzled-related protein 1-like isoform X2 [Haliotis rubra]
MEMEPQAWLSVFVCLASLASASEYDYNYYRDEYNNDGYIIHGDYPRDWTPKWIGVTPKCIDIPTNLTLCQDIGYKRMRLPNLLDHDTLNEVTQQSRSWVPLLGIHCHPDVKLFLCSLFSPVCLERTIWPCRSLCESVKNACLVRMKYYKFDWPEMLRCDKFPVDNDLCIKQQNYNKPDNNCTACKHPMTFEAIVDNNCRSQFVIRTGVAELQKRDADAIVVLKKKKKFYKKEEPLSKKDKKNMAFVIEGGASCQCDLLNDTRSKFLIMGNRKDNKFVMSFVVPWEKKNKDFKKALKKIKKGHECKDLFNSEVIGLTTMPSTDHAQGGRQKSKGKKKGGKRKKGKKGRKGKRKGKKDKKKGKKSKGKKRRPKKDRKRKSGSATTPSP